MKSFRTFLAELKKTSRLTELTDHPYPLTWSDDKRDTSDYFATFTTDAKTTDPSAPAMTTEPRTYKIFFTKREIREEDGPALPEDLIPVLGRAEEMWIMTFALTVGSFNNMERTVFEITPSEGQSARILSTVAHALQEFVNKTHPEVIAFTAKEPSRIKLYTRFVQQIDRRLRPTYTGSGPYTPPTGRIHMEPWFDWHTGDEPAFLLVRRDLR